jgi:hypothetical protein
MAKYQLTPGKTIGISNDMAETSNTGLKNKT